MKRTVALLGLLIAITLGPAAAAGASDRVWFGGGVGVSFGDVDYVAVEPVVGVSVTRDVSVGAGLIYRYRHDSRPSPSFSSTDYGGNLFARYSLTRRLFLQGEYEFLSYELIDFGGGKDRDSFDSLLGGAGISTPLGDRMSAYALTMYNFDYDDIDSPYDEPWVFRAGVTFGF